MALPWADSPHAVPADHAACRAMIRQGSRSFFAASLLLPLEMRGPAYTLYAFCRLADDAVDNGGSTETALARLSDRLDRAYAGRPLPAPADRAFADLVADYAIPRALPEALLEGLAWDAEGRRYDDLSALNAYAARVAGTVGVMMALLMGARAPGVLARACELGVAMQFTNIARDVGEDARMGRIYLPLAWLRDAGIDPDAWLARPQFDARLGAVVQRLLSVADTLYDRAVPGIAALPWACRPGILAARMLYAEIGRELERSGLDSVSRRSVVPAGRKLRLLAQAFAAGPFTTLTPRARSAPPLEEVRFLVDAVAALPATPLIGGPAWWDIEGRVAWVIDLFERMERRRRSDSPLVPSSGVSVASAGGVG